MSFDHVLGHSSIKMYLEQALSQNTLPHTLLFAGPHGIGKSQIAKSLAQRLLNTEAHRIETHPDFHPIRPEGKTGLHPIETLRSMIDEVYTMPFEASHKVFVIYDAERMQTASANALLKTLEEPPIDTTLILLTAHASELLPTIRSRCVELHFQPLATEEIAQFLRMRGLSEKVAKRSHGSCEEALALQELDAIHQVLFPMLQVKMAYPDRCLQLERLETLLEDEDPLKKRRKIEHVLTSIWMWHRDQEAQKQKASPELLFFPEEPMVLFSLPSLEKVASLIEEARMALDRNIKLSVCLESCFTS